MSAIFYHQNGRWNFVCTLRELEAAAKFSAFRVAEPGLNVLAAEYFCDRIAATLKDGGTVRLLLPESDVGLPPGSYPVHKCPADIHARITAALAIFGPVNAYRIEIIV